MFFYPISNYLEKFVKIWFVDNSSKEGYLTKSISDDFKYKVFNDNGLALFNDKDVSYIEIVYHNS